jgi:ankyrin repeat protein
LAVKDRLLELIGASVNEKDNDGKTSLHFATDNGHLAVIDRLVEYMVRQSMWKPILVRPLFTLPLNKAVDRLTELGASINERDNDGRIALHIATEVCHLSVVESLISLGASVNEKDNEGRTALHVLLPFGAVSIASGL